MMIVSRMLLTVALASCGVVVSMEKECRQNISIDKLLNCMVIPQSASGWNDVEMVRLYLNNGGNINAKGTILVNPYVPVNMKEMNLLMTSALYGRPRLMKFLIQNFARLDCTNEYGDTALMIAARNGKASLVWLLLKDGANPVIRNNYGTTALWQAERSSCRHHPFFNQKCCKNYYFPRIIGLLKRSENEYNQRQQQMMNARRSCPVLRITQ